MNEYWYLSSFFKGCEDALKNDPLFNVDACHKGCEMGASGGNDDVSMTTPAVQDKVALMSKPKNLFDIVFGEDIFKGSNLKTICKSKAWDLNRYINFQF